MSEEERVTGTTDPTGDQKADQAQPMLDAGEPLAPLTTEKPAEAPSAPPQPPSEGTGSALEEPGLAGAAEAREPQPETIRIPPTPVSPPPEMVPPPFREERPAGGEGDLASDEDRLMGALSWVGLVILQVPLISLVLLLASGNKDRPFQRYHAVTSLVFWVAGFIYYVIAAIVYVVLTAISLGCLGFFLWVIFFLPHLVALYFAYQAYQGRKMDVPFLSEMARSQGWV